MVDTSWRHWVSCAPAVPRVPVYCVDGDWWQPAWTSRYCRGQFILDIDSAPEQSVARLLEIAEKVGHRPILIPTTDSASIWVAENAESLGEGYCFPRQDASLVRILSDKGRMQELARRNGVPTAKAVVPRSKQDVEQYLESAVFPVMVKATDAESMRRRTGGTKFIIQSPRELLELYARAEDPTAPNLLIQEFIPGEDWMLMVTDQNWNVSLG